MRSPADTKCFLENERKKLRDEKILKEKKEEQRRQEKILKEKKEELKANAASAAAKAPSKKKATSSSSSSSTKKETTSTTKQATVNLAISRPKMENWRKVRALDTGIVLKNTEEILLYPVVGCGNKKDKIDFSKQQVGTSIQLGE